MLVPSRVRHGELTGLQLQAGSFQGVDIGTVSTEIYVPITTAIRKFDREVI